MPVFYFHLHNRVGLVRDEEGQELPDLDAARDIALQSIRDILSNEVKSGLIDLRGHLDIADETDAILATVQFEEAVEIMVERTKP